MSALKLLLPPKFPLSKFQLSKFLPVCLAGITVSLVGLTGCQPVPLGSNSAQKPEQRPVKPLYPGPITGTVQDGRKPKGAFEIVAPNAKKPKPGAKPTTGGTIDVSQQLADAADKAASAESLAQFAQTKDDWNQVFDRWKRALQILKSAPSQTPAIKQKIAEYNNGLEQATRDAQISMNPSLAPVDPTGSRATKALIGGGAPASPEAKPTATPKLGDKSAAPASTESPAPTAASPTPSAATSPKP